MLSWFAPPHRWSRCCILSHPLTLPITSAMFDHLFTVLFSDQNSKKKKNEKKYEWEQQMQTRIYCLHIWYDTQSLVDYRNPMAKRLINVWDYPTFEYECGIYSHVSISVYVCVRHYSSNILARVTCLYISFPVDGFLLLPPVTQARWTLKAKMNDRIKVYSKWEWTNWMSEWMNEWVSEPMQIKHWTAMCTWSFKMLSVR